MEPERIETRCGKCGGLGFVGDTDHAAASGPSKTCPACDGSGEDTPPPVKLIGADGNAFAILGACSKAARKAGWSKQRINEFNSKAMSGDYDHLLGVVTEHFDVS